MGLEVDIIGGLPSCDQNCNGCGKPLVIENAWMTDGCPCNSGLGINSLNETRWRLLMQLQQAQLRELEKAAIRSSAALKLYKAADEERLKETYEAHVEAEKWKAEGDMYGWNFHEGRAAGTTTASIIFYRIRRLLESWGVE